MPFTGRRLALGVLFALFGPAVGAQSLARRIIDHPAYRIRYTTDTLPNGLLILVVESHLTPVVSADLFIRAGNLQTPPDRPGLAHLVEHLTGDTSSVDNRRAGIASNATTGYSWTDYFFTSPIENIDPALWFMAAVLEPLHLDSAFFALEKQQVIDEATQMATNQAYGRTTICVLYAYWWGAQRCDEKDWERQNLVTAEAEVRDYVNAYYRPSNAVLVVVGDVNRRDVVRRASRFFGHLARGPELVTRAVPVTPADARVSIRDPFATRTRIDMAYPTVALTDADFAVINVIAELLRGPEHNLFPSRLFDNVQIWGLDFFGTGLPTPFVVAATLQPGIQGADAEGAIGTVMERLLKKPISAPELERVKGVLTRSFLAETRDGPSRSVSYYLGYTAAAHHRPDLINSWLDAVDRVTTSDVSRVIEKYFLRAPRAVVTTVPTDSMPSPHP